MEYIIRGFEPRCLFEYFEELSAIPRGSGCEAAAAEFLVHFAQKHGLWFNRDKWNNVVIKKPGSEGCEALPAVMLQGHTDMVCEKNADIVHDFTKDGIRLIQNGDRLRADGTTLGADNGVAVATMLALLEDNSLMHPPLECVFTVEEETGLTGARTLDGGLLSSRTMINLDSEEEGVATVSCAGGMRVNLSRVMCPSRLETSSQQGAFLRIELRGLLGGHSGTDIALERGNANLLMGRLLFALREAMPLRLCSLNGGSKDNAIPRECTAVAALSEEDYGRAVLLLGEETRLIHAELAGEPGFRVNLLPAAAQPAWEEAATRDIIHLLMLAPNGVQCRNLRAGGFTVSSLNLGVIVSSPEKISLTFAPRSSVGSLQTLTKRRLLILAESFGFDAEITSEYPGWSYAEQSPVREVFRECYRELTGNELKCEAIHAGLECGLFSEKLPGLDAIAIGPEMTGVHTPDEELNLASVERTYRFLVKVLERLAKAC